MKTSQLLILMSCVLILAPGCTRVGPDMMPVDRFDYTSAVADSWNEQVLMNIVRLRYSAWPVFVGVDQIVTAYTLEHSGAARIIGRRGISDVLTNDQVEAGWVGKYSERPTVIYKPLSGKKYVKAFLTPVQPASVLALLETGWPADHLGRIALRSVNEHYNTKPESGVMYRTDIEFANFLQLLKSLQSIDAVKFDIRQEEENTPEEVRMIIIPEKLSPALQEDLQAVKTSLGLDVNLNTFRVVRNSLVHKPDEIRIQGRSILQVLVSLATGVEIPKEHADRNIAPPLQPIPEKDQTNFPPLMTVMSGAMKPDNTFVAINFQDMWFWIDNTDHESKRSLVYALALITLLDSDSKTGGSVVIPVN